MVTVQTEIPVSVFAVILKHAGSVSRSAALRRALTEYAKEKDPYISAEEIEIVLNRPVTARETIEDTPPKDAATLRVERKRDEVLALISNEEDKWE